MGQKKFAWRISEEMTAGIYGCRVPGSGSGMEKLDVCGKGIFSRFRIENKFTEGEGYRITKQDLKKASQQALSMGAEVFWVIDLNGRRGVYMSEESFLSFVGDVIEDQIEESEAAASNSGEDRKN